MPVHACALTRWRMTQVNYQETGNFLARQESDASMSEEPSSSEPSDDAAYLAWQQRRRDGKKQLEATPGGTTVANEATSAWGPWPPSAAGAAAAAAAASLPGSAGVKRKRGRPSLGASRTAAPAHAVIPPKCLRLQPQGGRI